MEDHIDWAGDIARLTDGVVTSCLYGKARSGPTQPQDQGLRARRLPVEIGLELGGRLRRYAHEELAGQAKPIDPNGTTGPWRPTGHRPTTIMASISHGRCRSRWCRQAMIRLSRP